MRSRFRASNPEQVYDVGQKLMAKLHDVPGLS